jgi:hypothetical protein
MPSLSILNQAEFNIGLKRYYESLYEQLLKERNDGPNSKGTHLVKSIESKISLTLQ